MIKKKWPNINKRPTDHTANDEHNPVIPSLVMLQLTSYT